MSSTVTIGTGAGSGGTPAFQALIPGTTPVNGGVPGDVLVVDNTGTVITQASLASLLDGLGGVTGSF